MTEKNTSSSLRARGLNKAWGDVIGINDVDVSVRRGEITALIGPSGSGKTTLIRALSLLDPPDSGTIHVDDTRYEFPPDETGNPDVPWPDLTVVFQELFLWPHLSLKANITLPLSNRRNSDSDDRLQHLIEALDMASFIDRFPNETSLGQRQRAALARALMLNPSYILLDEITSALDVENVSVILEQLEELRDRGIGVLVVTHLVGFARRAADQIVFLEAGQVVERGGREILESAETARLRDFVSMVESAS